MDLRSIINADASSASRSQAPPSHSYPIKQSPQEYDINQSDYVSPKAYHGGLYARPAQPPPLQPPVHGDFRSPGHSSSHMTAQSPHSYTPTSSLSGNQYPFPLNTMQSASQSQPLQHYPQRDNHTPSTKSSQPYRHPSPSLHTSSTTTPGSSHGYSQNQRSHSTHSTTTPTSAQSQAPHNHRESPLSASSQTHPYHLYPHQHHSQPGTPLGPPSSYHRSRPSLHQEHSGSFEHQRSQSGGSLTTVQSQGQSPIADGQGRIAASPTCYHLSQPPLASQEYLTDQERERSLSVSPKTKLPSQTRQDSMESRQGGYNTWGERVLPANQMQVEPLAPAPDIQPANHDFKNRSVEYTMNNNGNQVQPLVRHLDLVNGGQHVPPTPYGATSIGVMNRGLLDLAPSQEQQRINTVSPTSTADGLGPQYRKDMSRPGSRDQPNSASSSVTPLPQQPTTPQPCSNQHNPNFQSSPANIVPQQLASAAATTSGPSPPSHPSMQISGSKRDADAITSTAGSPMQPTSKRPRHDEPPIFARKASRSTSNSPLLPNKRQSGPRGAVLVKQEPQDLKPAVAQMPMPALVKEESNGHPPQPPSNEVALPKAQPELAGPGPLGPWEPSILNLIPSEEVTRVISDFLFTQVVLRDDVGAGPAGGGPGQGAVLEIEAKIGQLIDKNTNDRLRLPVMSECVVSKDDPNVRINFKSSMTESQHRSLNGFLNKALVDSQPPKQPPAKGVLPSKARIPMSYVHTKECDAFYELSQTGHLGLPPSIRAQLNPRHRAKVRITTDQKTGKELAKIVKARVADLDVYSPRTAFDWRVSVNLEMNYDGDMKDLVETTEGSKRADRNKDRMSYRHLAYQIDLTQVTPSDSTSKADKEHELEIEVSSAEIRRQGLLAKSHQASQYEDLIRGFVDNVRVLARYC